ncbi:HAUS augmin-like complex subunit 8 [Dipodomys merriami]|uniref:HAUS augmin-like complex subunit 8 n=1 Tax=Dipodomys merriami TaxID=94247 RepID=UPI003855B1E8
MADSSGPGPGKLSGPGTPSARAKGKRAQGGRVVESRYLQYEKKVRKDPASDPPRTRGKAPEAGRKAGVPHKARVDSGLRRELQSSVLEGHGSASPHRDLDLDLSAIHDSSMLRKTLPLEETVYKQARTAGSGAPQRKSPDLLEMLDMIESQTLLLCLLTVKIENNVARMEAAGGRRLSLLCREWARLQRQAHELRHRCALRDRRQALAVLLDTQDEMLRPFRAVADRFREQYRDLASALDSTRHELPVHAIHLPGDGPRLLDALQPELQETQRLLRALGVDAAVGEAPVLGLLSELRTASREKDAQLRRFFWQVLELDAEASREAALRSQQLWEEAVGPACGRWYFGADGGPAEPAGIPPPAGRAHERRP